MALNKTKTDPELGRRVHEHLVLNRVETPTVANELTDAEKTDRIEHHFRGIMEALGLDLTDDSLMDSPRRVAKMFVSEIFWGLDYDNFPKCTAVENKMRYDEMVVERNISVMSSCEHHFVVIDGAATVAYIPGQHVLGLSKLNRIVEYFAKRPQIQERLTEQIYFALQYILGTDDIAVVVDAIHYCVRSRGVEDHGSSTVTSKLGGRFRTDPALRAEFMSIVNKH
jgi:GTP cyclohydrolase I